MKTQIKYGHLTIRDSFPDVFDQKMQEALNELEQYSPIVQYLDGRQEYCAVLRYTYEEQIPQDARDRHELAGDTYKCWQCPYFEKPDDKRVKWGSCHRSDAVKTDTPCCKWLYEQIDGGKVSIE